MHQGAQGGTSKDNKATHILVLVGGFLAPRSEGFTLGYWGPSALQPPDGWRVIVVHPSPVASLHDRACQLFYQLKGGPTHYGHDHAAEHGHAEEDNWSSTGTGLYPEWDAENPVWRHFFFFFLGGGVRII